MDPRLLSPAEAVAAGLALRTRVPRVFSGATADTPPDVVLPPVAADVAAVGPTAAAQVQRIAIAARDRTGFFVAGAAATVLPRPYRSKPSPRLLGSLVRVLLLPRSPWLQQLRFIC